MIGKKIRNPAKGAALRVRVQRLADYIDQPESAPPNARAAAHAAQAARVEGLADYARRPFAEPAREKCIHGGARGFQATTRAGQKTEMLALAEESAHSKDPINHSVLSWPAGEQPTPAQVEEAVDLFLDELGLTGHQVLYGLHADTDHRHLHLMVNRVHPITRKVVEINKGFDLEALHRAVARIEHAQGWRREAHGRYRVQADGTVKRVNRSTPEGPAEPIPARGQGRWGDRPADGAPSAESIAAEEGAPLIRAAGSWLELHERLAAIGLRYARAGSGARVWVGETAVKASQAGQDCRLSAVERRLGPHQPAPAELAVAVRWPDPDRADTPRWAEYGAARRRYSAEQRERAMRRAGGVGGFPGDEEWLVAGVEGAVRRRRARLIALGEIEAGAVSLQAHDLRAFVAVVYGRRVDYRRADDPDGPAGFVDRGKEIVVHAEHDRDTVRAALQLAAQKWGRFQVEGDAAYRALCASVAAECGLPLGHPERQGALRAAAPGGAL